MRIAIDGPSGAGKSTISKHIAKKLGFVYMDTGAMYRTVGLFMLRKHIAIKSEHDRVVACLDNIDITLSYDESGQMIFLNGEDVTGKIRTPEVSVAASDVAVIPEVRKKLVEIQRTLATGMNVIMDGRDIGTYVLPDAEIKIFLTASVEDRAQRRFKELCGKGVNTTYDDVLKDMRYRDANDSGRSFAPLKPAKDAKIIDTTGNTFEMSVIYILEYITSKLKELGEI